MATMAREDVKMSAALIAQQEILEVQLRDIEESSFQVCVERIKAKHGTEDGWYFAHITFQEDEVELQRAVRDAIVRLKKSAIAKIETKLTRLQVESVEPLQLPAPRFQMAAMVEAQTQVPLETSQ